MDALTLAQPLDVAIVRLLSMLVGFAAGFYFSIRFRAGSRTRDAFLWAVYWFALAGQFAASFFLREKFPALEETRILLGGLFDLTQSSLLILCALDIRTDRDGGEAKLPLRMLVVVGAMSLVLALVLEPSLPLDSPILEYGRFLAFAFFAYRWSLRVHGPVASVTSMLLLSFAGHPIVAPHLVASEPPLYLVLFLTWQAVAYVVLFYAANVLLGPLNTDQVTPEGTASGKAIGERQPKSDRRKTDPALTARGLRSQVQFIDEVGLGRFILLSMVALFFALLWGVVTNLPYHKILDGVLELVQG